MKDGNLTLRFDEGKIVKASIGAGLDAVYERIFSRLKRRVRKGENIDNNIILFLVGCFMLEATINKTLEDIMLREFKKEEFRFCLWNIVKTETVYNKLKVIATSIKNGSFFELEKDIPMLVSIFSLRNKMVHYRHDENKLEDLGLRNVDDIKQMFENMDNYPEHELMQELKGEKFKKKVDLIYITTQALRKISGVE